MKDCLVNQELSRQLEAIARQIAQIQQVQSSIVLPDQPPVEVRGIAKETTLGDRPTPDDETQLQLNLQINCGNFA